MDFSFPEGQGVFGRPGVTTAASWRRTQYRGDCQCWKILDQQFTPSYR